MEKEDSRVRAFHWILPFLLLVSSCSTKEPVAPETLQPTGTVSLRTPIPAFIASDVDSVLTTVNAEDFETIQELLAIHDTVATVTIDNIPAGYSRIFLVQIYTNGGTRVYSGSDTINVPPNVTTTLTVETDFSISVELSPSSSSILRDGVSTSTITATVTDNNADPLNGMSLNWALVTGTGSLTLGSTSNTTNVDGQAMVMYTSDAADSLDGSGTVQAMVGGSGANTTINLRGISLAIESSKNTIIDDGVDTATITLTVTETVTGTHVVGKTIEFNTNLGTVAPSSSITDSYGKAATTLTTISVGTATVIATLGNSRRASVDVMVAPAIIKEADYTGDGTDDIKADNGIMWIQVDRDPLVPGGPNVKGYISSGGLKGQGNFLGYPIVSTGMVDQVANWATKTFDIQIIENTFERGTYTVTSVDTAIGKELTRQFTVTLEASKEYAWIDYHFTNTGSASWTYDEKASHIHDGAEIMTVYTAELYDIDAYINGIGVINLTSKTGWASYTPDQTAPFAILYRPSTGSAVTFGFKAPWDHTIHQVVAYYTGASATISPNLDFMATEFTLNPGASAQWRALVAFHAGGSSKGIEIYHGSVPP